MSTPPDQRGRTEALRERSAAGLGRVRGSFARRGLSRPAQGRLLAGVIAGLGRRFGLSPAGLRVAFVVSMLFPGPQFLLYVALWVLMPRER